MLEELLRDALAEEAADVCGPNESDLLERCAHRDDVRRFRRVAVTSGALVVAALVVAIANGLSPGGVRRLEVAHHGGANGRQLERAPRHASGSSHKGAPAIEPATGTPKSTPANVVVVPPTSPTRATVRPNESANPTPATSPATTPVSTPNSTPATAPQTTPTTAPPALTWTMNAVPSSGSTSIFFQGTGPPGATITTNTPYLQTQMNDGVFPVYFNGAWGGVAGFTLQVGQTIDITMTCSCGGSRTFSYTRTS